MDEATKRCYAQFSTDGIVTLKEIDLGNGMVKREIRLTDHYFPQNTQVYKGEVYYMFLDTRQTNGRIDEAFIRCVCRRKANKKVRNFLIRERVFDEDSFTDYQKEIEP